METNKLLQRVYDKTNDGLDIITDLLPAVDDAVINLKKAFRLRTGERTASAHVYPPDNKRAYWHVKDFGMGEGGGFFSPIDLYMWDRGYSQDKFRMAVEELAEKYGVQELLSRSVNKPDIEQRAALPDEIGAMPRIKLSESLHGFDLSCWGANVKTDHLETYGWKGVSEVAITCDDKVIVRKPTPAYPIFAQQCEYTDEQGQTQVFYKVYEPKNPDKAHRFLIVGRKPQQNYIYGLQAVRQRFQKQGEEKLSVLLLVSGGSDAIAALSYGYPAVWLDSETKGLSDFDYGTLMKYTKWLVNIPDIDATGIKVGEQLALTHLGIHTAWMTRGDMGGLRDNRGRQRKDLRDYLQLHPSKKAMDMLVNRAVKAKFWTVTENKQGQKTYSLSLTSLNYFLELNGFFTLKDESRREPVYIHIDGMIVEHITAKTIAAFLQQWMQQQGLPNALQDKVLRSHDLPTNQISHLAERDDLDFTKATATSQRFYFRNGWVEVTAKGITRHPYSCLSDSYVWQETIVDHDYRNMPPMFEVSKDEGGNLLVKIADHKPSKLLQFIVNASRLYWRKADESRQELTDEERSQENRCLLAKLVNIGYLLHSYKSESAAWATFCFDSTMGESEDDCNGRSGKSFYLKALGQLLKTFSIEARVQSIVDNRFLFDGVTEDTDLIIIDECHKALNFDFFFGRITGTFRGEAKGDHPFEIPFSKSPKFAFGTNYTLRKSDPSTMGRVWPQIFSDYYHEKTKQNDYRETRKISDDFGCNLMGTEYPEADWQADIAFLLQCVKLYLSLPAAERKVMPPMEQVERRAERATVGKDFEEWAEIYFATDSGNLDREIKQDEIFNNFSREVSYRISKNKLTTRLKAYCDYAAHIQCLNPAFITGKPKDGERIMRRTEGVLTPYYYVQSVKDYENRLEESAKNKAKPEEQELPF